MMYYYIKLLIKSWWPNGKLMTTSPPRTEEEKLSTRYGEFIVIVTLPYHTQGVVVGFPLWSLRCALRICWIVIFQCNCWTMWAMLRSNILSFKILGFCHLLWHLVLEGGTSKFSWNTGNKPTFTAQQIRRVKTWKFFRLILSLPALWYYLVCFELTPCYLLTTYEIV